MNVKRTSIFVAGALALAAATLPLTAAAHDRWERGWRGHGHGHGHGHKHWKHGHGHYKPWNQGYYRYPRQVIVPAPVYAVPYPRYVPVPAYGPPPVYYPPAGNDLTIVWRAGW